MATLKDIAIKLTLDTAGVTEGLKNVGNQFRASAKEVEKYEAEVAAARAQAAKEGEKLLQEQIKTKREASKLDADMAKAAEAQIRQQTAAAKAAEAEKLAAKKAAVDTESQLIVRRAKEIGDAARVEMAVIEKAAKQDLALAGENEAKKDAIRKKAFADLNFSIGESLKRLDALGEGGAIAFNRLQAALANTTKGIETGRTAFGQLIHNTEQIAKQGPTGFAALGAKVEQLNKGLGPVGDKMRGLGPQMGAITSQMLSGGDAIQTVSGALGGIVGMFGPFGAAASVAIGVLGALVGKMETATQEADRLNAVFVASTEVSNNLAAQFNTINLAMSNPSANMTEVTEGLKGSLEDVATVSVSAAQELELLLNTPGGATAEELERINTLMGEVAAKAEMQAARDAQIAFNAELQATTERLGEVSESEGFWDKITSFAQDASTLWGLTGDSLEKQISEGQKYTNILAQMAELEAQGLTNGEEYNNLLADRNAIETNFSNLAALAAADAQARIAAGEEGLTLAQAQEQAVSRIVEGMGGMAVVSAETVALAQEQVEAEFAIAEAKAEQEERAAEVAALDAQVAEFQQAQAEAAIAQLATQEEIAFVNGETTAEKLAQLEAAKAQIIADKESALALLTKLQASAEGTELLNDLTAEAVKLSGQYAKNMGAEGVEVAQRSTQDVIAGLRASIAQMDAGIEKIDDQIEKVKPTTAKDRASAAKKAEDEKVKAEKKAADETEKAAEKAKKAMDEYVKAQDQMAKAAAKAAEDGLKARFKAQDDADALAKATADRVKAEEELIKSLQDYRKSVEDNVRAFSINNLGTISSSLQSLLTPVQQAAQKFIELRQSTVDAVNAQKEAASEQFRLADQQRLNMIAAGNEAATFENRIRQEQNQLNDLIKKQQAARGAEEENQRLERQLSLLTRDAENAAAALKRFTDAGNDINSTQGRQLTSAANVSRQTLNSTRTEIGRNRRIAQDAANLEGQIAALQSRIDSLQGQLASARERDAEARRVGAANIQQGQASLEGARDIEGDPARVLAEYVLQLTEYYEQTEKIKDIQNDLLAASTDEEKQALKEQLALEEGILETVTQRYNLEGKNLETRITQAQLLKASIKDADFANEKQREAFTLVDSLTGKIYQNINDSEKAQQSLLEQLEAAEELYSKQLISETELNEVRSRYNKQIAAELADNQKATDKLFAESVKKMGDAAKVAEEAGSNWVKAMQGAASGLEGTELGGALADISKSLGDAIKNIADKKDAFKEIGAMTGSALAIAANMDQIIADFRGTFEEKGAGGVVSKVSDITMKVGEALLSAPPPLNIVGAAILATGFIGSIIGRLVTAFEGRAMTQVESAEDVAAAEAKVQGIYQAQIDAVQTLRDLGDDRADTAREMLDLLEEEHDLLVANSGFARRAAEMSDRELANSIAQMDVNKQKQDDLMRTGQRSLELGRDDRKAWLESQGIQVKWWQNTSFMVEEQLEKLEAQGIISDEMAAALKSELDYRKAIGAELDSQLAELRSTRDLLIDIALRSNNYARALFRSNQNLAQSVTDVNRALGTTFADADEAMRYLNSQGVDYFQNLSEEQRAYVRTLMSEYEAVGDAVFNDQENLINLRREAGKFSDDQAENDRIAQDQLLDLYQTELERLESINATEEEKLALEIKIRDILSQQNGELTTSDKLLTKLVRDRQLMRQAGASPAAIAAQTQAIENRLREKGMSEDEIAQFIATLPKYEIGGPINRDGAIYAHQGEFMLPKDLVDQIGLESLKESVRANNPIGILNSPAAKIFAQGQMTQQAAQLMASFNTNVNNNVVMNGVTSAEMLRQMADLMERQTPAIVQKALTSGMVNVNR